MHARDHKLNLIMLGTGQHRDSAKNILTALADAFEVTDHQSVHLMDGPAGKSKSKTHPMLGTYDFSAKVDPSGKITTTKTLKPEHERVSALLGNVKGEGYEDAIEEARIVVNEMLKQGKTPLTVNMFGFSRGADTVFRIANVLYGLYGDAVQVNIFAVDQVPGLGRQGSRKARVIPPNVKEYNVFLMEDEQRFEFEAQNRSHLVLQNPKTKLNYFMYKGNHGFATRFEADPTTDVRPIHDAPKLLWGEATRFADRANLKFKGDIPPAYVVAGKKVAGKRAYQEVPSEELDDDARLTAYTRMGLSSQAYFDHVRGMSNFRSKLIAAREFLDRKTDYFLHGHYCFQDKQHMLLFKEAFPAVFDYFFQQNIGGASPLAVQRELTNISANPDLTKFMADLAGIDVTKAPTVTGGIYLDADEFYLTNSELRRIWEGVVEAVGAVLSGYDKSISKTEAQKLQDEVLQILIDPPADTNVKIATLKALLPDEAKTRQANGNGNFAYKLATIAGSLDLMNKTLAQRTANKLNKYINRSSAGDILRNKELVKRKKAILIAAQKALWELHNHGYGNEIDKIQTILSAAYAATGETRTTMGHPKEGDFENTLREHALAISNYAPFKNPTSPEEKAKAAIINPIMDQFHQDMHGVLQPVRDPKLQSYMRESQEFIIAAKKMLASRKNIESVDRAIATCSHLQHRLQKFDEKLWEDDSRRTSIQAELAKLADIRSKLNAAKAVYDTTKTYSPSSVLSFSRHTEVVTVASPDKLEAGIKQALAKGAPAADTLVGSFSDTAEVKTTKNVDSNTALVGFTDIETGMGLFKKTTTVASVQRLIGDDYRQDIYCDPAQLSRFGTKGYLNWAEQEFKKFIHTNPQSDRHMIITDGDDPKNPLPEKLVRLVIAYCKEMKIPYTNNTQHEPNDSDLKLVRERLKQSPVTVDSKLAEIGGFLRETAADVPALPTSKLK